MISRHAKWMYYITQTLRREPVVPRLKELEETQWIGREQLKKLQWLKLKSMLIYAYEQIPFYHHRFLTCEFDPYTLNHPEQLRQIPLLTKQDIQQNFKDLIAPCFSGPFETETTSGSTGDPMKFIVDRNFAAGFRASVYRGHQWAQLPIGAPEARFFGMPIDGWPKYKEKIKDGLMNRIRCSAFDLSDETLFLFWKKFIRFKPDYLYGYTSAIARFSMFVKIIISDYRLK